MSWIHISTRTFDDDKIKLILAEKNGDFVFRVWMQLLILGGKLTSKDGTLSNGDTIYTDKMISAVFGLPVTKLRKALDVLIDYHLISAIGTGYRIENWTKYQNMDAYAARSASNKKYYMRHKRIKAVNIDTSSDWEDMNAE